MTDINGALNQITGVVQQVATLANQVNVLLHPEQAPAPAPTMRPDQWQPTYAPQPAQQPVAAQSAPTGFRAIWDRIVNFFRNLFGRGTSTTSAMAAQSVGSWPAYNTDARAQLWAMFPTGRGNALGVVPFTVTRNQDAIVMDAGFSKAAIAKYQGEYFFYNKDDAPVRIAQVTSQRAANGSTQFNLALENGKQVNAAISADGHSLSFDSYTVTLN